MNTTDYFVGQSVWWQTPVTQSLCAGRIIEVDDSERQPIFKIDTFDSTEFVSGVELNPMTDEDIEFVLSAARRAFDGALRSLTASPPPTSGTAEAAPTEDRSGRDQG